MKPELPTAFLKRLEKILSPENYQTYMTGLSKEKVTAFRVNTLKISVASLIDKLEDIGITPKPIPWCQEAFTVACSKRRLLTQSACFKEGLIYIQNPASIFATLVLNPKANEEVLDLAAAPGGKTLHMAALMQNQGRIAAVEAVKERFFRLQANIKQSGAQIVHTYQKDGAIIGRLVPERFDKVLLDAPCSSEGRFDLKDPSSFAYWSEKKIKEMQRKQKKLIYSAIQCLKQGGCLVYCTCAFSPEENEAIIQYALNKFGKNLQIEPIQVPFLNFQPGLTAWQNENFSQAIGSAVRIIPNEQMNGFFICKISKQGHI